MSDDGETQRQSKVRTTFHGGEAENGRIEFYEYSRSAYALARLIGAVEIFRRTGKVPMKITNASSVEQYVSLPEAGSWTYVTNIIDVTKDKLKIPLSFDAVFAWATGRALDNVDLINSNTDAILNGKTEVDLSLAKVDITPKRRSRKASDEDGDVDDTDGESDGDGAKRFNKRSLNRSLKAQKAEKAKRVSVETEIAVARAASANLAQGTDAALAAARTSAAEVQALAANDKVRVYDEEEGLVKAMAAFSSVNHSADVKKAEQAARLQYAANDLGPRFNRRYLGDAYVNKDRAEEDELDKLASKARPLLKEIVLPLRKSPTDMDLAIGDNKRRIIRIDEVRGRMLSDSFLTEEEFDMRVFVIEYNRVTHSGKCRIESMKMIVPFSLERQLINRLTNEAIDGLRQRNKTFTVRPFVDHDGSIRSLLVSHIDA